MSSCLPGKTPCVRVFLVFHIIRCLAIPRFLKWQAIVSRFLFRGYCRPGRQGDGCKLCISDNESGRSRNLKELLSFLYRGRCVVHAPIFIKSFPGHPWTVRNWPVWAKSCNTISLQICPKCWIVIPSSWHVKQLESHIRLCELERGVSLRIDF